MQLSEIIKDTYTNSSGVVLFDVLDKKIKNNETVNLSFKNSTPMSSSFFNSSIGALIDKYSLAIVRKYVKFTELQKSQYDLLIKYINNNKEIA